MPTDFERPTRAQIFARAQSDIEGEVDGVSAQVRHRPELANAVAITGAADALHAHLAWCAEQILPDQAVERFVLRQADFWGVVRTPASPATGTVLVTGTGGTVPADAEILRVADGLTFTVDDEHTPVTSESVAITAAAGFEGAAGNLTTGSKLQFVSNIAGISSEATVQAPGLTGGADQESIAALLVRVLDRIQRPPLGGAPGNHVAWAMEVPGVTRAWEYAGRDGNGNPGIGKVAVTFVRDLDGDPIPDAGAVADVQAYLDDRSPAEVIVFAPTPVPFDWHVVPDPNTGDVQTAITAEVTDLILRDREPGGTIKLSRFEEAVSTATGEDSHETLIPTDDVAYAFGEIPVPGTPDYTP